MNTEKIKAHISSVIENAKEWRSSSEPGASGSPDNYLWGCYPQVVEGDKIAFVVTTTEPETKTTKPICMFDAPDWIAFIEIDGGILLFEKSDGKELIRKIKKACK